MSRRAALTITEADLQAAFALRRRADWPATYAQAMANPLLRQLVRAEALGRAQALQTHAAHQVQHRAPLPRLLAPPPATAPVARPLFDRKRLAAGERDND